LQKKETKTSDSTNHFLLNRTLIALFAIVALLANFFNIKKMHHTDSTEKTASFKVGVKLSLKKFLKKNIKNIYFFNINILISSKTTKSFNFKLNIFIIPLNSKCSKMQNPNMTKYSRIWVCLEV
jgi:hypothetical protein